MVTADTQRLLAVTTAPVSGVDLASDTYNIRGRCNHENVSTTWVDRVAEDCVIYGADGRTGF